MAIDTYCVVGTVADFGMAFTFGLDVGTNTAVPQQVHFHAQNGFDQLVRRHAGFFGIQHFFHLRG